ncbi:MAG: UDP-N-acetylmuramate dehydrogenase [Oscillospiraceae bacterium]|jgi:UDP-N-acetylmuramate dehydrogenase|nr:UDP-N-acetylmuramate dehydrogenase [Oscillospiraceae bacterium]
MYGIEKAISQIRALETPTVIENKPMSELTTFKIGGPISAIVFPNSFAAVEPVISVIRDCGSEPLFLGNGSNLLCADDAIKRIAVCSRPDGSGYQPYTEVLPGNRVAASTGSLLGRLAMFAMANGLSGLEWASGIPGTLGGAVKMNAGAYGGEMSQIIETVTVISASGKKLTLSGADCRFSYRHSRFCEDEQEFITTVVIKLQPGDSSEIQRKMKELSRRRKENQPIDLPSAGSVFKRPANGYAADLIEKAGLKGYRVGGAAVSEKHSGFIVNLGGALCSDVLRVMEHVQEEVLRQFGVGLEPEIKIITA